MAELLPLLIVALLLLPFWLGYGVARLIARRRLAAWLHEPRPLTDSARERWPSREWLARGWRPEELPETLSLAVVLAEWAEADPDVLAELRLTRPWRGLPAGSLGSLVARAWEALPPAARERSAERLRAALRDLEGWWSGAERGWTGRPFVLPPAAAPRKGDPAACLVLEDLTAAPLPGPFARRAADEAPDAELPLFYALQRRTAPRFVHPLAPPGSPLATAASTLAGDLAVQIGQRIGARFGAILGPVGAAVGQYLGGMAGKLAGSRARPVELPAALRDGFAEAEAALARLGEIAAGAAWERALVEPEERVLRRGGEWERLRARRARWWREKLWPTLEVAAIEAAMEVALAELRGLRAVSAHLRDRAPHLDPVLHGGILLQNPWLARTLVEGPERLSAARRALNRLARRLAATRPAPSALPGEAGSPVAPEGTGSRDST